MSPAAQASSSGLAAALANACWVPVPKTERLFTDDLLADDDACYRAGSYCWAFDAWTFYRGEKKSDKEW